MTRETTAGAETSASSNPASTDTGGGSALKILIADDSNSDRLLLKAIVQSQGHQPLLAADGAEAIEMELMRRPPRVLLAAEDAEVSMLETLFRVSTRAPACKSSRRTSLLPRATAT